MTRRRRWTEVKGMLLRFPRSGVIGVPYERRTRGWNVVVIWAPEGSAYPRGGHNIAVADTEVQGAEEMLMGAGGVVRP